MKRNGWRRGRKKRLGQWKPMIGKEEKKDQSNEKNQFLEVEVRGDAKPIIGKKDHGDGP